MTLFEWVQHIVESHAEDRHQFTARSVAKQVGADIHVVKAMLDRMVEEGSLRARTATPSKENALPYLLYRVPARTAKGL